MDVTPEINPTTAEKLRVMLSELQLVVMEDANMPRPAKYRLVDYISQKGFRLVDDLAGDVR